MKVNIVKAAAVHRTQMTTTMMMEMLAAKQSTMVNAMFNENSLAALFGYRRQHSVYRENEEASNQEPMPEVFIHFVRCKSHRIHLVYTGVYTAVIHRIREPLLFSLFLSPYEKKKIISLSHYKLVQMLCFRQIGN